MKNQIIVLTGPTASGKTALSLLLAKKFGGEIICADSMTVYRGMDIGTDKPSLNKFTKREGDHYVIQGVPHHLLDIVTPDTEFNVSNFQKRVNKVIEEIHSREHISFLVGGSTMYIDAVVYGYEIPEIGPDQKLRKKFERKSCEELFSDLVKLDPDAEWTIDRHNMRRLIRALEVTLKTGIPFSRQKKKNTLPDNVLYLSVKRDREKLYRSINSRVDEMMDQGFLDEVKGLYEKYDHNTAMQAAGYKQLAQYCDGAIPFSEAVEKTKQVHRNYAKRQLTWLGKNKDVIWVEGESDAQDKIQKFLSKS